MKAVVKYGNADKQVELRDVPEPEPGPGEVLLETRAAGVCGSDIEMWRQALDVCNVPVIQGHEFCGVVQRLGPGVTAVQPGDRVVSETAAYVCGQCRYCASGEYNLCPKRLGFGYGLNGAFTRFVRVPVRCLHHVPDPVPDEYAALTEPVCVAYNALAVKTDVRPGEPALILGPGPIGLFAVQIARIRGASPVILAGTEVDAGRLAVGREVGADVTVQVPRDDLTAVVHDLTGGDGAPLVVDCAGGARALASAIELVARNGTITKIAWDHGPVTVDLAPLVAKAARLQGSFSHTWRTWEAALSLIASGQVRMAPMISHQMTIDQWQRAFELVEARAAVKVVLRPI